MKFPITFNKKEIGHINAFSEKEADEIFNAYKKFGCFPIEASMDNPLKPVEKLIK